MTDNQLTLLLHGLLAELDAAIEAARDAMPEDAERVQQIEYRVKTEYAKRVLLFEPIEQTHDKVTIEGDYTALAPLVALWDAWAERFEALGDDE